jgi:hypothetical protein
MKRLFNNIFILGLCSLLLFSCKKDDSNFVTYTGGVAPVLSGTTNTGTENIVLAKVDVDKPALNLSWTNPDYQFSNGISSQDVNYTIEVDTVGTNFATAQPVDIIAKSLSAVVTEGKLNFALTKLLKLKYDTTWNIQIRMVGRIGTAEQTAMTSNVLNFKVSPYLDVAVPLPTSGELWALGSAFASSWDNPMKAPYTSSQKFTRVSETSFELVVDFIGGGGFKVIQEQGNWGTQYHALDATATSSGSFEKKDSDPQFPGQAAGTYKIVLDFLEGKYTITKL